MKNYLFFVWIGLLCTLVQSKPNLDTASRIHQFKKQLESPDNRQGYRFEFVDCKFFNETTAEIEHFKAQAEAAIVKFKLTFPDITAGLIIRIGYLCAENFDPKLSIGSHKPMTTVNEGIIESFTIHPSQKAVAEQKLKERIVALSFLTKKEIVNFQPYIEQYLSWRLSANFQMEIIFHELIHALNDRSNLPELFKPYIKPSFNEYEKADIQADAAIMEQFRKKLTDKLLNSGFPEKQLSHILLSEGSNFYHKSCVNTTNSEFKKFCLQIQEFNKEINDLKQIQFAQKTRTLYKKFHLPNRHLFDEHVWNTALPKRNVYDEEYLVISAEIALLNFCEYNIYELFADDPNIQAIYNFWQKTDFKEHLILKPSSRNYYYSLKQISQKMEGWVNRYPQRVEQINFSKMLNLQYTVNGKEIYGIKINSGSHDRAKRILIDAGHHADEVLAIKALSDFIDNILKADLFNDLVFYIIPALNVDGLERVFSTKAEQRCNAQEVDLNRNYPTDLPDKISDTDCLNGKGTEPLSEVETQLIDKLTDQIDFNYYISLHSAGNELKCSIEAQNSSDAVLNWCASFKDIISPYKYQLKFEPLYGQSSDYLAKEKHIPSLLIEIGNKDKDNVTPHMPLPTVSNLEIKRFFKVMTAILHTIAATDAKYSEK